MSTIDDIIITAVNRSLGLYEHENLVKLTEAVLPIVADELRAAVRPTDRADQMIVCYAQSRDAKDKWQPGAMLAVPGRAVAIWGEGILRPRTHSREVLLAEGGTFQDLGPIASGRLAIKMRHLRLAGASGPVDVGVPDLGRATLAIETLSALLLGAVTFD